MLRPVTTRTIGAVQVGELRKRGETGGCRALDADSGLREGADRPASSRSETRSMWVATSFRTSTAYGIATRTASPSANVSERSPGTGRPASKLSAITGAPAATTPMRSVSGEPARTARADAAEQRAVPDRHDDGRRAARSSCAEELVADRGVAVVLRRLGAVLEERHACAAAPRPVRAPSPRPGPRRRAGSPRRAPRCRASFVALALLAGRRRPPRGRAARPPRRSRRRGSRWRR